MTTQTATLADGTRVEYWPEVIGEGGFKRVHFSRDKSSVVCFFKDQAKAGHETQRRRLTDILGRFNPTTDPATGAHFKALFCWPTALVTSPELGITTPSYPKNFFFATGKFQGKEKNGKWFFSPKLRKLLPAAERGDWRNYLELGISLSRGVARMHLAGLAHSDLSCNNVLLDPPQGRCVIIDVDSLVVPGLFPPDVVGTAGYIAPEVLKTMHLPLADKTRCLPNNTTDLYALAVLLYESLLRRHPLRGPKIHNSDPAEDDRLAFGEKALFVENPTDTSNRPTDITVKIDDLGPYIQAEFLKAFVEGLHTPTRRPTAARWESALRKTADLLLPCANAKCEEKWFVYRDGVKPVCPWCKSARTGGVPVLDLFYAPKPGQFRAEGHSLAGHDGKELFPWHARTDVLPNPAAPAEAVARVRAHAGKWILQNIALDSMISPKGNPVPAGQACFLADGDEVRLSRHDKGRLVCVRVV